MNEQILLCAIQDLKEVLTKIENTDNYIEEDWIRLEKEIISFLANLSRYRLHNKMNNDYIESISDDSSDNVETAKKMITRSLIAGEYDLCYNIPLNIENNSTVINEAFKKAITGGWYDSTDVEINPVECIISSQ